VDGVFLLGVVLLSFLVNRFLLRRESGLDWLALGLMALTFGLTLLPWLSRNLTDTGQLFPGGGLKTLFLREYDDFFSYTKPLDLPYYLNQTDLSPTWGIGPLLGSKLDALFQNLLLVGRGTLFFMAPLFLLGFFSRNFQSDTSASNIKPLFLGLQAEFLPFTIYLVTLYLAMSLVFTFPSTRGSVFHSSGGLLPFLYLVILAGLDRFIAWLGTISRPKAGLARRRTYSLMILAAALIMSVSFTFGLANGWNRDYSELKLVGAWLSENGVADALVMAPDVPAYYYVNHRPAIVITNEPLPVNLELARRYGARYFILQPNHAPASLAELFAKKTAPGFRLVAELGEVQLYRLEGL
ncbi:MAG: hypothetical protein WCS37_22255, partial [Chloroflexota bacterium]